MRVVNKTIVFTCTMLLCYSLIFNGRVAIEGAINGVKLCAEIVVPSTFAFMVVAGFIPLSGFGRWIALPFIPITRHILHLSDEGAAAVIMSFIGGYPAGTKTLSTMVEYDMLPRETAARIMLYATNLSPSFAIIAVGQLMWGRPILGLVIYLSQILASLIIGYLVRPKSRSTATRSKASLSPSAAFVLAVSNASSAMVAICGFIVFFSCVTQLVSHYLGGIGAPAVVSVIVAGLLEVTGGCKLASELGSIDGVLLSAFFMAFAGLSIIFQNIYISSNAKISTRGFFGFRVLNGLMTSIFTYLALRFIPSSLLVMAVPPPPKMVYSPSQLVGALCLMGMCIIVTLSKEPAERYEDYFPLWDKK